MKTRKIIALMLALVMALGMLTACGTQNNTAPAPGNTNNGNNGNNTNTEPVASHYPVTIDTYNYAKEQIKVTFDKMPEKVVCTNQTQTELMLYFGLD